MNIKSIFKEKTKPLIFLSAFVVIAAVLYVVLVNFVFKDENKTEEKTIGNHGETVISGKPFVMEPVESKDIISITVDNAMGGFEYYLASDGQYYFRGIEKFLYATDSNWQSEDVTEMIDVLKGMSIVDNLVGVSRYMLSSGEVENYNKEHLENYGLDNGGKARLTLKHNTADGKQISETVIFGNITPSGSGYYVQLEGRDALYILPDNGVTRCIFTDEKSYIHPLCAGLVSSSVYMEPDEFSIEKNGKTFVSIKKLSEEKKKECGDLYSHYLEYPENYYPSSDAMEKVLSTFTNFSGTKVVEYKISELVGDQEKYNEVTELFKLYSLIGPDNNWVNHIKIKYDAFKYDYDLYISEKLKVANAEKEEYIYYVYSPIMDTIVEIDANKLTWLEFDTIDYIEEHAFFAMIDTVKSMEFSYGETFARFELTGDGADLKVTSSTGIPVETNNFRQLYKAMLLATVQGEIEEIPENPLLLLTVKVQLENGDESEYHYYGYTARKAYYSLNGEGKFYINRDYVKQLVNACTGILKGETIKVEEKI